MNNQIELTIIPENASDNYDLSIITETADSIYWTMSYQFDSIDFYYKIFTKSNEDEKK